MGYHELKKIYSLKISKNEYRPLTNEEKKTLVLSNSVYLKYSCFYCISKYLHLSKKHYY